MKISFPKPLHRSLNPKFKRPNILLHPQIPKPLHGQNPRVIFGSAWWNDQRQRAYAKNNFCCFACGIYKLDAKYHHWLEAHECYVVDYGDATLTFVEVVALCHLCHNFIHLGRLEYMLEKHQMTHRKVVEVKKHGNVVLQPVNSKINPFVRHFGCFTEWSDWKLVVGKKVYKSKFSDEKVWRKYYAKK